MDLPRLLWAKMVSLGRCFLGRLRGRMRAPNEDLKGELHLSYGQDSVKGRAKRHIEGCYYRSIKIYIRSLNYGSPGLVGLPSARKH